MINIELFQWKNMKLADIFNEASGGPEITGQYAPTNQLLKPEFPPKQGRGNKPVEDELVDKARLETDTIDQLGDMDSGGGGAQYNLKNVPDGSQKDLLLKKLNVPRITSHLIVDQS